MKREFPPKHRVMMPVGNGMTQTFWKDSRDFDEWCEELVGYDVIDDGMYTKVVDTPHGTVEFCYSQWRLECVGIDDPSEQEVIE